MTRAIKHNDYSGCSFSPLFPRKWDFALHAWAGESKSISHNYYNIWKTLACINYYTFILLFFNNTKKKIIPLSKVLKDGLFRGWQLRAALMQFRHKCKRVNSDIAHCLHCWMAIVINVLFLIVLNWMHKWPRGDSPYIPKNYLSKVGWLRYSLRHIQAVL